MTGYFNCRVMPLRQIAEAFDIKASDKALLRMFARFGYHYHIPDYKPFLTCEHQLKQQAFVIANWDRIKEYWRRGFYYNETTVQTSM